MLISTKFALSEKRNSIFKKRSFMFYIFVQEFFQSCICFIDFGKEILEKLRNIKLGKDNGNVEFVFLFFF